MRCYLSFKTVLTFIHFQAYVFKDKLASGALEMPASKERLIVLLL